MKSSGIKKGLHHLGPDGTIQRLIQFGERAHERKLGKPRTLLLVRWCYFCHRVAQMQNRQPGNDLSLAVHNARDMHNRSTNFVGGKGFYLQVIEN